jgi:hypothetical protein
LVKKPSRRLREMLIDIHVIKSYSQEGEDMFLQRIFEGEECGFYVDVEAHHLHGFSNTHFFYKRGWKGINIEPNPAAIEAFRVGRKGDISLQLGVVEQFGSLKYYFFDEPTLDSFDGELVKKRLASIQYKVVRTSDIPVERLDHILTDYFPPDTKADVLSIDIEGLNFQVLKLNNWDLYKPQCVLVESLETS